MRLTVGAGTKDGTDKPPASLSILINNLKNRMLRRDEVEEMLYVGQVARKNICIR